jgi:hypothetical protein
VPPGSGDARGRSDDQPILDLDVRADPLGLGPGDAHDRLAGRRVRHLAGELNYISALPSRAGGLAREEPAA